MEEKTSAFWMSWVTDHIQELFHSWSLLTDQASRDIFLYILRYRISGPAHVRFPLDTPRHWALLDQVYHDISEAPDVCYSTPGENRGWKFPFQGRTVYLHSEPKTIFPSFYVQQYYLQRDGVRIQPEEGDHVVDAGTCAGESTVRFALSVGPRGRVYGFDPVAEHVELARHNARINGLDNIVIFPYGLFDKGNNVPPSTLGGAAMDSAFRISPSGRQDIPLVTVDDLLAIGEIERVDFLKMDIEGVEMNALQGAAATIRKFRPKLAICVYHRAEDLYVLPRYIQELNLGYRIYLDHHTTVDWESVLYATVD